VNAHFAEGYTKMLVIAGDTYLKLFAVMDLNQFGC
jgi:hypothetical protein